MNDQNVPVREKKAIEPLGVLLEQLQVFALMENKCTEVVWPFLNIENDGSVRLGVGSECAKRQDVLVPLHHSCLLVGEEDGS